jgi:hypothetical protein
MVWRCRAKYLKQSIEELLQEKSGVDENLLERIWSPMKKMYMSLRDFLFGMKETNGQPTRCVDELYKHPLIFGLFKGDYQPYKTHNLPSYIQPRDFARALIDIVVNPSQRPSGAAQTEETRSCTLESLQQAIGELSTLPKVKKALRPLVDAAEDDINKARKNIEDWYNSAMERVTGWYKKHTQWIVLVLAFIVTALANADTIIIVQYLSLNDTARNAIVGIAEETVEEKPAASQETENQPAIQDCNNVEGLAKAMSSVREIGLPIGWSNEKFDLSTIKLHLVGWVITAIALSMGASFWFDCLKKLINIRSSLKPEEKKSAEEPVEKKR